MSPSRVGVTLTNAPKSVVFTTVPWNRSPTAGITGLTISLVIFCASSAPDPSREPMNTVPSSWMSMSAPVSAMISLIFLPFGPITSPILSTGIWIERILGAIGLTSSRGAGIAASMTSRIVNRASRACFSASARTSPGSPDTFMSSWIAVTNSRVPATLKSMSPSASSAPRMSVRVTNLPFSAIILMAALTSIPQDMLDAARVDGCNGFQRYFYIVRPMVMPILFIGGSSSPSV